MDPHSTGPASAGSDDDETEVIIEATGWHRLVPGAVRLVRRAMGSVPPLGHGITVLLSDDRTVRRLNARDRGRDKPTNVLTYPPPTPGLPGQIVLALETVQREAAAAGKTARNHLAHLLVHGALHLAGHDHHEAGEARRMEMEEARILRRIGVPNPWRGHA
jgi:probable rRNA maturation factor